MAIKMDMEDMKNGIGEIGQTGIIEITMGIWNMIIGIAGNMDTGGMKILSKKETIANNGRRHWRGDYWK